MKVPESVASSNSNGGLLSQSQTQAPSTANLLMAAADLHEQQRTMPSGPSEKLPAKAGAKAHKLKVIK